MIDKSRWRDGLVYDLRNWPIVIISVQDGTWPPPPAEEIAWIELMMNETKRWLAEKTPFAYILDARNVTSIPRAKTRAVVGAFQRDHRLLFERYMVADATVLKSRILRGFSTAINWLAPSNHPQRFFAELPEAIVWAKDQLQAAAGSRRP